MMAAAVRFASERFPDDALSQARAKAKEAVHHAVRERWDPASESFEAANELYELAMTGLAGGTGPAWVRAWQGEMWVRFGEARTDKDMPGGAELFAHVLVQGWLMDPRERLVARRHLVLIDHAAGRTSADQAIKSMRKIASEMRGRGSYGPAATTNLLMADHQLSRGTPEPQTIRLASQLLADAKSDAALSRDQRLWGLLQWYYGTLPLAPSPELLRHALRNLDAEGAPEAGVLLDTMDTDTPQKPRFSLYGLHEVWHRRPA